MHRKRLTIDAKFCSCRQADAIDIETDFIINYDIKFRMGLGGEDAEE